MYYRVNHNNGVMRFDTLSKDFEIGGRYTYHTKDECYKVSLKAIRQGYQVRYGKSYTGHYFFEIVDPFESE